MAGKNTAQDTWTRTEKPPSNQGEPKDPRDAWDARLQANGGKHR